MKKVYDLARLEIGTYEWAEGSNPRVDAYFDDVGYPSMTDETAWCAAFVGAMLKRCGGFGPVRAAPACAREQRRG